MQRGKLKSCLGVVVVLCLGGYTCAHKISEHRARYPGNVTFTGHPLKIFGSRYMRAFMRRGANDASPLPDVTVHVDGRPYKLSDLTEELVKELGSSAPNGRFRDPDYNSFSYRFEERRLTGFSVSSGGWSDTPAPDANVESVALSIGDGPSFTLPITHRELVRHAGRPDSTYLTSGQ